MILVGAGLGNELQLRARVASVFGAEVIGDNLHFSNRAEIQGSELVPTVAGGGDVAGGDVIHSDIVASPAPSIGVVTPSAQERIVGCDRRNSRRGQRE